MTQQKIEEEFDRGEAGVRINGFSTSDDSKAKYAEVVVVPDADKFGRLIAYNEAVSQWMETFLSRVIWGSESFTENVEIEEWDVDMTGMEPYFSTNQAPSGPKSVEIEVLLKYSAGRSIDTEERSVQNRPLNGEDLFDGMISPDFMTDISGDKSGSGRREQRQTYSPFSLNRMSPEDMQSEIDSLEEDAMGWEEPEMGVDVVDSLRMSVESACMSIEDSVEAQRSKANRNSVYGMSNFSSVEGLQDERERRRRNNFSTPESGDNLFFDSYNGGKVAVEGDYDSLSDDFVTGFDPKKSNDYVICPVDSCGDVIGSNREDIMDHCLDEHGWWQDSLMNEVSAE